MEKFPTFTDDLKSELQWLENNKEKTEKISGIKQQKFLLFYNLFLKAKFQKANFIGLCAWNNGPVYTQFHAAVKHYYTIEEIISSIKTPTTLDESLAKIAKFVIELLTDEEVSELTHKFDFWQIIDNNYENNEINLEKLSKNDERQIKKILQAYNIEFINQHKVYKTGKATFLINKNEYEFVLKNFSQKLAKIKNDKPIKIELNSINLTKTKEA
ncbi:MAG: hypothetical protein ACK5HR_02435 [Mycoplasmatales bacterium]